MHLRHQQRNEITQKPQVWCPAWLRPRRRWWTSSLEMPHSSPTSATLCDRPWIHSWPGCKVYGNSGATQVAHRTAEARASPPSDWTKWAIHFCTTSTFRGGRGRGTHLYRLREIRFYLVMKPYAPSGVWPRRITKAKLRRQISPRGFERSSWELPIPLVLWYINT